MDAAFETALRSGDVEGVRARLDAGVDVDSRDRHGQSALMVASHRGDAAIVAALLDRGAGTDVTAKYGLSALMLAVVGGHGEVARMLARAGADRSLRGSGAPGFAGKTAYDLAVARAWPADVVAELKP